MHRGRLQLLFAAAVTLAAACRHRDADSSGAANTSGGGVTMRIGGGAEAHPLQRGDIRIVSVDSGVDLALLGDTVSGGLSQYSLAKVKRETDTLTVKGTGVGADIERMVKGTVQSAVATRVAFPVSAVRDVRYEGGRIIFDWNDKPRYLFGKMNVNKKDVMGSFSPADAERFVDAVRARRREEAR
jgi:hypothetical protein